MNETRVIFCSDVHLCDRVVAGRTSEDRMDDLVLKLTEFYGEKPFEKIVFLGDYSLDHHHGGDKKAPGWKRASAIRTGL